MYRSSSLVAALLTTTALAACSEGGGQPAIDASPDTPPGPCGAGVMLTGEIIDWDATAADFCGVFGARLTLRGTQSPSDMSRPNGRFELCVTRQAQGLVDVMHSTDASPCVGVTGSYPVRAVIVAQQAVIDGNGEFSARAMTQTRQDDMFTQIGQPYDATKAQLVVHVKGAPGVVSISANHATPYAFDGSTWGVSDIGTDVLFPNVDPGSTQVTVAGGAIGATTLTLEAGAYTYLSVIAN